MTVKRRHRVGDICGVHRADHVAPLVLEPFWLNRIAKYLVFGMLGIAVALSWGYAGILNLGQGLFFGAGAYMLAMSLKLASHDQPAAGLGQAGAGFHAVERRARLADRAVLHQQGLVPVAAVPESMVRRRDGHRPAGRDRRAHRPHRLPQDASPASSSRSSRWRWCCWSGWWSSTRSPSPTASTA